MATATKPRKKADPGPLDVHVSYGNVNIGDESARLGCVAHRGNLTVAQADKNLCGKRLRVKIVGRAASAQAEQGSIPGIEADVELEATADVKSIGVSTKTISFGLTFALESVDVPTLAHFAKRDGVVTVFEATDIPADDGEGEEGGDE
jgi:hypothetical protein